MHPWLLFRPESVRPAFRRRHKSAPRRMAPSGCSSFRSGRGESRESPALRLQIRAAALPGHFQIEIAPAREKVRAQAQQLLRPRELRHTGKSLESWWLSFFSFLFSPPEIAGAQSREL